MLSLDLPLVSWELGLLLEMAEDLEGGIRGFGAFILQPAWPPGVLEPGIRAPWAWLRGWTHSTASVVLV